VKGKEKGTQESLLGNEVKPLGKTHISGVEHFDVGDHICYTSTSNWHAILIDAALRGNLKGYMFDKLPPIIGIALIPKTQSKVTGTDHQEAYRRDADGRWYLIDSTGGRGRLAKFDIAYNPDKWSRGKGGYRDMASGTWYSDKEPWADRRVSAGDYKAKRNKRGKDMMDAFHNWLDNEADIYFGQSEEDKFKEYLDTVFGPEEEEDWADMAERQDAWELRNFYRGKESESLTVDTLWKLYNYCLTQVGLAPVQRSDYLHYQPPMDLQAVFEIWDEAGSTIPNANSEVIKVITEEAPIKKVTFQLPPATKAESAVVTACTTVMHPSVFPVFDLVHGSPKHVGQGEWHPGKIVSLEHVKRTPHPVIQLQDGSRLRLSRPDALFGPETEKLCSWRISADEEERLRSAGHQPAKAALCPDSGKCCVLYVDPDNNRMEGDGGDYTTSTTDPAFAVARQQTHHKYSGSPVKKGVLQEGVVKASNQTVGTHARGGDGLHNFYVKFDADILREIRTASPLKKACVVEGCTSCSFKSKPDIVVIGQETTSHRLESLLPQLEAAIGRLAKLESTVGAAKTKAGNFQLSHDKNRGKQQKKSTASQQSKSKTTPKKGSGTPPRNSETSPDSEQAPATGTQSSGSSSQ